ncbi:metallophosphoesterase [Candidatus Gracilibacteria bacterium]|nr:metallophosphoesterase [Candidatus Gracilibacteria bacterium]
MHLVLISDTHTQHNNLSVPDGDVLVHAGDITRAGSIDDLDDFNTWLGTLPHRHKLYIAGNHDWCFFYQRAASVARVANAQYLQDESISIAGVLFYGSPWQPNFHGWAFNLPRGAPLRAKWQQIPPTTQVLITHGPPHGIGDLTIHQDYAGCSDLREIVGLLQPRLHVFGHIHEGYGIYHGKTTVSINACSIGVDKNRGIDRSSSTSRGQFLHTCAKIARLPCKKVTLTLLYAP